MPPGLPPPPWPTAHVYVHVPFCAQKCAYCDFNSYAGREGEMDAVVDALLAEARGRLDGRSARTLYVGGGTPTFLDARRLARLLEGAREAAGAADLVEFSVEANPGTLDAEKAGVLARAGVTRVSLGAQSFSDRHLATLGRIHSAADVPRAVGLIRSAGIRDLSLDLILALPGQTLAEQDEDLGAAVSLAPAHVSAYVLSIEERTPFARAVAEGRLPPPDPDREARHLDLAVRRLAAAGLERYEVSNFARPGHACRHNLGYWRDADWAGIGPGAHSHRGSLRWKNVDDPADYAARIRRAGTAVAWVECAPAEVALFEALMMGLRLVEGVDLDDLARRTGCDARALHAEAIACHVEGGRLAREGGRLRPTARGLSVLSRVLTDFVPDARPATEILVPEE